MGAPYLLTASLPEAPIIPKDFASTWRFRFLQFETLVAGLPTRPLAQVRHQTGQTKPKPLKTGSGYCRVCTTFAVSLEVFRQADAELPEQ